MTPTDRLREAARVLRGSLDRLTPDRDEWDEEFHAARVYGGKGQAHLTVHPGIVEHLADWLDDVADDYAIAQYGYWSVRALAVADAVLGGEQS